MGSAALIILLATAPLPPVDGRAPVAPLSSASTGRLAYIQRCATCHGTDLRGGLNGPGLRGVGAADVDFWVRTGRMPAAVPWIQVGHRGAQLSPQTIDAIVAYVSAVQPGGPAIPVVVTNGDPGRGQALFRQNCMHCHGADATGGAIGESSWAPGLRPATITQVAEAVRIGPGEMPSFGERQLDANDLDDIVSYVSERRADAGFSGLPFASNGPVPEGLYGWIAAALMALIAYAFSVGPKENNQ